MRVIKVIDRYTIVINKGSDDGVAQNDKFLVYGLGDDLIDLETNESLGALEIVRGRARVSHLQDRVSTLVCTDTQYKAGAKRVIKKEQGSGGLLAMAAAGGFGRGTVEEVEEGGRTELLPFKGVEVGDYVKPI